MHSPRTMQPAPRGTLHPLLAGLLFALVGLIAALVLLGRGEGGWNVMIASSTLAAFLTGTLLWAWLVPARRPPRLGYAVLAGALAGLLSHPLAWFFAFLALWIAGARSSLDEPAIGPLAALSAVPAYTLASWTLAGWVTVPLGALTGGFLAAALKWRGRAGGER